MSLTTFSILLYLTIAVGWVGFLWILGALIKEGLGAMRTARATTGESPGSTSQGGAGGSAA